MDGGISPGFNIFISSYDKGIAFRHLASSLDAIVSIRSQLVIAESQSLTFSLKVFTRTNLVKKSYSDSP